MEEYNSLIRQHAEYKKVREDRYKCDSKDRLSKILRKKVETTMIGALSSVEKHLGFLWTSDDELTPEQKTMYEIYQKVREEVLDKGNSQARNVDAELNQYDVKWLRYTSQIPVKPQEERENG
tara:strand:- start:1373 stop:1738 length:366 start_codon:yes stop_codon:yes gene_type:complete